MAPNVQQWEAQLRKGAVEMAILAALSRQRLYGLEILRVLEEVSNLLLTEGTIYPILSRLKAEGLVASEWEDGETGHARKYYVLTRSGRARLKQMANAWVQFSRGMKSLLDPVLAQEGLP